MSTHLLPRISSRRTEQGCGELPSPSIPSGVQCQRRISSIVAASKLPPSTSSRHGLNEGSPRTSHLDLGAEGGCCAARPWSSGDTDRSATIVPESGAFSNEVAVSMQNTKVLLATDLTGYGNKFDATFVLSVRGYAGHLRVFCACVCVTTVSCIRRLC